MKVEVHVVPGAREEKIEETEAGHLKVWTRAIPEKGAVNRQAGELLAAYFDVPKSSVTLVRGNRSRTKLFEITTRRV